MNDMLSLSRYPYSDNKVLDQWNELGNMVDAASSESFVDLGGRVLVGIDVMFYFFVFMVMCKFMVSDKIY